MLRSPARTAAGAPSHGPRAEPVSKRTLWNAGKYGLGFALLGWVIWRNWSPPEGSGPGLADALQRPIQALPLVLAALCCLFGVILTFVRWYVLVRAQDLPFTMTNAVRLGLIGYFLSTFLPGSVGGDIIKAAFLAREQSRRTVAVATVLLDRAIGMWALFWVVGSVGLVFWFAGDPALHAQKALQTMLLASLAIITGTMLLWFVLGFLPAWRAQRFALRLRRLPKVGGPAAEFWQAVWMYRNRGRSMALALALAIVGHFGFVLTFYFSAQVFDTGGQGVIPSLAEHFVLVPFGMIFQAFFPSPGGLGGGEWGFGRLYDLVGSPKALAVLGSLAQRVVNWAIGLVGYLVYLRMRPALLVKGQPGSPDGIDLAPAVPESAVA
jgi:glycosyltransferase 2 family protein